MSEYRGRRRTPGMGTRAVPAPGEQQVVSPDEALLTRLRHELRTPINAIIGYAEMIMDETEEDRHEDLVPDLTRIIDEGQALLALVNRALYSTDRSVVVTPQAQSIFDGPLRHEFEVATIAILNACEWLQRVAAKTGNESLDADLRKIALASGRVRAIVGDTGMPVSTPPGGMTNLAAEMRTAVSLPAPRARLAGEPGHILIVDDQAINRELLARRLVQDGYTVAVAAGGREAMERVHEERFDIVLLDVLMPETSGFEVLSRLKGDPRTRDIPVLMISALDEMQSVVHCIEMGADDYLTTPIDPILLRARISSSLERKRRHDDELSYMDAIRRETNASRVLEDGMLPRELPRVRGVEMAAFFKPAQVIAGDFYEVVRLPGDRVGVVLGDVHSSRADTRLFIALTRSVLRTFAERLATGKRVDPLDVVMRINGYVRRESASTAVSLVFAVLDPRSGLVHYVNAGHVPPVILNEAGIRTVLIPTGPTIGAADDNAFARETAELSGGDCLLIHSDGITEAQNKHGAIFSEERLHGVFRAGAHTPASILARVEDAMNHFMGSSPITDDITVLAIRRESND